MTRARRTRALSAAAIVAFSGTYAGFAAAATGSHAENVQLTDGSVWVTRTGQGDIARLNHQIDQLDAQVVPPFEGFDIVQDGYTVFAYWSKTGQIQPVDTAAVSLGVPVTVPKPFTPSLGGGTLAITTPVGGGETWILPSSDLGSFDPKHPTLTRLGSFTSGSPVAVGENGVAYAYSVVTSQLVSVQVAPDGTPSSRYTPLQLPGNAPAVEVTAVGSQPVVLDQTDGVVVVPGHAPVQLPSTGGAPQDLQVQPPGPANSVVYVASDQGVYAVPLSGGPAEQVQLRGPGRPSGVPVAPVFDAGCLYAAWQGNGSAAYGCGAGTVSSATVEIVPGAAGPGLVFRVNRDVVVLNDAQGGDVWDLQRGVQQVAQWAAFEQAVSPPLPNGPANGQANGLSAFQLHNHPPIANPVHLGVRPGQTTDLPVLLFDSDPNGFPLSIASPTSLPSAEGTLQVVGNGTEFQYTPPPGWQHGSVTFPYQVTDGAGGNDVSKVANNTTVTVTVEPMSVDHPPRPATAAPTTFAVAAGKTLVFDALGGWYDPQGDPFDLVSVTAPAGDGVTFSPGGSVALAATGRPGRQVVHFEVADPFGKKAAGEAVVDVGGPGQLLAPRTNPFLATAVAGVPTMLRPLTVDTDPNDDPLQLASVTESKATLGTPGVDVAPNLQTGEVAFQASRPGTYYLQYVADDLPPQGAGKSSRETSIRVDVASPGAGGGPVAASQVAYLPPGGSTLVPVLDGSSDPAGNVLVVQSVSVPFGSPLQASVYQNEAVRISTSGLLPAVEQVSYTITDGHAESVGEIEVLPAPAGSASLAPVAEPLQAAVRAGSVGTINPLASDFDPSGATLSIVPGSVGVNRALSHFSGSSDGFAFTDSGLVRYAAPSQPGQAVVTYAVTDPSGQTASSTVEVTVQQASQVVSPPTPEPLQASMLSGTAVVLPVPLAGVDPAGESVELLGPTTLPRLGQVTAVTPDSMTYRAFAGASGTDTFSYALRDQSGLVGYGTVRIGIGQPGPLDAPPVTVPQTVRIRPQHTVRYPVLAQDYDPQGYPLRLVPGSVTAVGTAASVSGDAIVVQAPALAKGKTTSTSTVTYQVTDGFSTPVTGVLTVVADGSPDFSVPPVAEDIVVASLSKPNATIVDVNLLAHVSDPGGSNGDLRIVGFPGAAPEPAVLGRGTAAIRLTKAVQVIVYEVRGADGVAEATITVPARGTDQPALRPGRSSFSTRVNTPYPVSVAQFVSDPAGRPLRIVSAADVQATEGTVAGLSAGGFRFVPLHDYAGPASVWFEVTDGPPGDQSAAVTPILLQVSVVGALPPAFRGPTFEVQIGQHASFDLFRYVDDPNRDVPGIRFSALRAASGLGASITGTTLGLFPQGALGGTTQTISFSVSDGLTPPVPGEVLVNVVQTTRPLAVAPPQTASVDQGQSVTVPVLKLDLNPFPGGAPLLILSARVVAGQGSASPVAGGVAFTAGRTFSGTATVIYTLEDQTHDVAREVQGTISITVFGRPATPGAPQVLSVGNARVLLAWTAPADNGQPITHYLVSFAGRTITTGPSTTLTVTGLHNGSHYSFTVAAENSVGTGPASQPSPQVMPNTVPEAPAAPTTKFGSKSILVTWLPAVSLGTRVEAYYLTVSPPPASGPATVERPASPTSYDWPDLVNGTAYTFTVQAVNAAGKSAVSGPSAPQVPAGDPSAPGQPTAQAVPNDPTGGKVDVQWPAVTGTAADGAAVAYYTLTISQGSSTVGTDKVTPTSETENPITVELSGLSNNVSYSFTVTATNKAGTGPSSASSSTFTVYGQPGQITDLSAVNYQDNQTTLNFSAPSSNGQAISGYKYSQDGGAFQALNQTNGQWVVGGLNNGQTYTFQVEACNTYCGAPSNSASAEPDGNPTAPPVSGSVNGTTFSFSWGAGTPNGCSIPSNGYGYSVSSQGGGPNGPWTSTTGPGSVQVSGGYNQTITVWVWATDSCGHGSGSASSGSATSGPPPGPTVTITGPGSKVTCSGTGGTCYWVDTVGSGFPANTNEPWSCWDSSGEFFSGYTVKTDGSGNVALNGTNGEGCQYGAPGTWVQVEIGSTKSQEYTWPPGY